jgi:Spy/CpxP family protein refolding chaperone
MRISLGTILTGVSLIATSAAAQESPYTQHTEREIKALSAEEVEGYLAGKGMGMALAAELNSYPGPKHVLELADSLKLSDEQQLQTRAVFDRMKAQATRLGQEIVERERWLDGLFASGEISEEGLEALVTEIGLLTGELRYHHLRAHLAVKRLLLAEQAARYDALRGYGDGHEGEHRHEEHRP